MLLISLTNDYFEYCQASSTCVKTIYSMINDIEPIMIPHQIDDEDKDKIIYRIKVGLAILVVFAVLGVIVGETQ